MPLNVTYGIGDKEMDEEGRMLTAEYEKFFLVNAYVPNAGRKLVTLPKRLRWNKLFKEYIQALDRQKAVIICGDMNVAHEEIGELNEFPRKLSLGIGFNLSSCFSPPSRFGQSEDEQEERRLHAGGA